MRVVAIVMLLVGCGDNKQPPSAKDDAGPIVDAGSDAATPDATPGASKPCLDRPIDLPRPPDQLNALPCDLLPPDFAAP